MHFLHSVHLRRFVSALCALSLFVGVMSPVSAFAAEAETEPAGELTIAQAQEMEQADQAITGLTESAEYAAMSQEERQAAAAAQLEELASQNLILSDSIYYDEENGMYSFSYTCGVWGGLTVADYDDDSEQLALPLTEEGADMLAGTNSYLGNAMIYYAFDDTVNSTRYPNYVYMQSYWNELGLQTDLDSEVTVRDLRHMDDYDLCILSAHGLYYTYTYNYLFFWEKSETAPVVILMEESNLWKDLSYAVDLLCHRVIKIDGKYSVLPSFFRSAYSGGKLEGTIVFSEACEFMGVENHVDFTMGDALLQGGAEAVIGYVNTVYTIYSRNLVWDTVNQMIMGKTIRESLEHAVATYGSDDIEWYLSQGGLFPHRVAAYPVLGGNWDATLYPTGDVTIDAA